MKFIVENWHLFAMALLSGGMLLWPLVRAGGRAGSVATTEAVRLINREKAVLIDVREPGDYAAGHAAGSRSVPLAEIAASKSLPANKALPLILLCASGSRAGKGAAELRKLGYANVQTLQGGLAAWREANLPVEKAGA